MRIVTAALVALAVSPAAAQPQERSCEVRFVRAPDDVRHVIETWLAAEPRCTSKIDLRVIPTEQGYYLIAQRPDGRLHERYVPDAQSAGVLVASWVADDWVTEPSVWSSPRPTGMPVAEPALAPPQDARPTSVAVSASVRRDRHAPRWISAGALFSATDSSDGGLRLELDVIQRGNFTLGASLAWTETSMAVFSSEGAGELRSDDVALNATGTYTLHAGRWELRTTLGIGGVYSDVNGIIETGPGQPRPEMPYLDGSGAGLIATASMVLSARISERWGVHAGLLAHAISERFPLNTGMPLDRKDAHMFVFTGLRRRI